MDLWTEFEGVTIDSAFSLKQLLQTEGRSAFFSTVNAKGDPVLIRIIECHFDEDEILARWRGVETLGHPAFLRIDRFGQFLIEEDQIVAVYAVFERVDDNLGQVLERGRLTPADATQIGRSVASALHTLHANGFIHQHVEAHNIYAVGPAVKLRSDCIRETPEGPAGVEARRRDVHDLAVLLMQVLKGAAGVSAPGRAALPAPFDDIVRNGMSGEWGLAEIQAALAPPESEKKQRAQSLPAPAAASVELPPPQPQPRADHPDVPEPPTPLPGQRRASMELPVIFGISQEDMRRWMTAAGLLLAVVLIGAYLIHHWTSRPTPANAQALATRAETASTQRPPAPSPHANPQPSAASIASALRWRVVAFTYNHRDQAQKKAATLARKYPTLAPAAFSPSGRAPWLVTVGGPLDRDTAYALARKARSLGLPRDTYAQNYNLR